MNVTDERKDFFENIKDFWYDLEGEPYALYDLKKVEREEIAKIRETAEKIYRIYHKTSMLMRELDVDVLLELGYPKNYVSFIKNKTIEPETIISRLDMVKGEDGEYKHYELNADTPTFIRELFEVNGKITEQFGYENPNKDEEEKLKKEIKNAILDSYYAVSKDNRMPHICFVAHKENQEDWYTTKYLSSICELPNKLIDFEDILLKKDGLYDQEGQKIDVLYRQTYPIEYLLEDRDEQTGELIGIELMKLVEKGFLSIINPLSAFALQNKAIQALIWGLYEDEVGYFDEEEQEIIAKHFIPTYFEEEQLENKKYVRKPIFGREGDTIEIYDERREKIKEDPNKSYTKFKSIYQEYVPLPKEEVMIDDKIEKRSLLYGTFLISGQASAIGCRVGNEITGNESAFLSIGYEK